MAKMKKKANTSAAVLFDVVYEDGTQSSRRRVPGETVGGLDGDAPAKAFIEAEDRRIAEMSGRPRGPIKTITRSPVR